ncbi:MAG: hypothetical protein K6F99_10385 [Lachnospiraceae bacterium]|nr:hypothetical protein [Lachnospiraceae bacterium]
MVLLPEDLNYYDWSDLKKISDYFELVDMSGKYISGKKGFNRLKDAFDFRNLDRAYIRFVMSSKNAAPLFFVTKSTSSQEWTDAARRYDEMKTYDELEFRKIEEK